MGNATKGVLLGGLTLLGVTDRHGGHPDRARVDPAPERRLTRVQEELRRNWREVVRLRPPAQRERWLDSQDGRSALGSATCTQLLNAIRTRFTALAAGAASSCWVEAWESHGELPPGLDFDGRGRLTMDRSASALVLGVPCVRTGLDHPAGSDPLAAPIASAPTARWTPPQAVAVENLLDSMGTLKAIAYDYPASPSAHAIRTIEARRGREREVKPKAVGRKAYRQAKAEHDRRRDNREPPHRSH
jgi:hypothetical protein